MPTTPWGDAETLRERRLPPGRGGSREVSRREQRERLYGAMVASCSEKGFDATSVEDLLRISGVSRATFYELFDDKLDCFRATEEELIEGAVAAVADRLDRGDDEERSLAALEAFVGLLVAQPAAARMCLVEAYAAGDVGIEPVRAAVDRVAVLGSDALARMSGGETMPFELARAIVRGVYQVIYRRLLDGRVNELPGLVPELWAWVRSFPPPPQPLRRPGRIGMVGPIPPAPPFAAFSPEQRIVRGFAAAVGAKGYRVTTIADIAAAASISQTTFYEHFEGKIDAMRAALDSSGEQLRAAVLPPVRRAQDWRAAVRIGYEEVCAFYAAEPDFASLRMIGVYAAGPEAILQRDEAGMEIVRALMASASEELGEEVEISDLVVEATVGALLGVLFHGIRNGRPEEIPRLAPFLTYLALSPFLGAEEAYAVATARGRGGGGFGARRRVT